MNNKVFSDESLKLIDKISTLEQIDKDKLILLFINYHSRIKECIKKYKEKDGLTDYILKSHDYIILYTLCKNTKPFENKIELLLVFMYSYYKLDDFHFPTDIFNINNLFKFIKKNGSIHSLIYNLVTNKEFLKESKGIFNHSPNI